MTVAGPFSGSSRFTIVRQIGAGGFGTVYEVLDLEGGEAPLALKTLARFDAASLYRFKREFRVFADIHHRNLVRLHELVSEGTHWFFTMDLVEGVDWLTFVRGGEVAAAVEYAETMDSREADLAREAGVVAVRPTALCTNHVDLARVRATLVELVVGLSALHQARVIHRDMKPANVLVKPDGHVVILDFGLATTALAEGASMTDVHAIVGTPAYMAPEQATGTAVSAATDWYALGTMLFEALTGTLPFGGMPLQMLMEKQSRVPPRPSTLAPGVPPELDELCVELLQIQPQRRPDAADILRRLGAATGDVAVPSVRTSRVSGTTERFVGRADVLRQLTDAYAVSRAGTLALALVHGTSGMGKTAAARAFVDRVEGKPVVLQGRCFQRESVPYKAFDQVMDSLTRYLLTLPREEVAGLMPREISALARIFPVLERVPVIAEAPHRADIADSQLLRKRAFAALRELLTRLTDRRPVILVLDDVQWGDADSAGLLGELTSPPDAPPLLLLLAYRSEEAKDSPLLAAFERRAKVVGLGGERHEVVIPPLSTEEARELAEGLLGDASVASHVASTLANECLGSPFFLGELVQYAQTEAGKAERKQIRLEDLIALRISQLTDEGRLILRLACISGGSVGRSVAMRASGLGESPFTQTLGTLRIGNMVKLGGLKGELIEPFHDRIREAVLAEVALDARRDLHRGLAGALVADANADPETLLVHYAAGDMPEQARVHAKKAAEKATATLAFERAAALWSQALSIGGWDEPAKRAMQLARAEALVNAGRGALAADAFLAVVDEADPSTKRDLMRRAGEQLLYAGEMKRGMEVLGQVLRGLGERLPSSPGWLLFRLFALRIWLAVRGWSFRSRPASEVPPGEMTRVDVLMALSKAFIAVEPSLAAYCILRLATVALSVGEPRAVFTAMAQYATMFGMMASDHKSGMRWSPLIARAYRMAESLEDPRGAVALVDMLRGTSLTMAGQLGEAEPLLERSLLHFRDRGVVTPYDQDASTIMWAVNRAYAGAYSAICIRLPEYLRDAVDRGDLFLSTNLRVTAAAMHWLIEDKPAQGRADIEAALRSWGSSSLDFPTWGGAIMLDVIAVYEGRPEDALAAIASLAPRLRSSNLRFVPLVSSLGSLGGLVAALAHLENDSADPARMKVAGRWRTKAYRDAVWYHLPILHLLDAGLSNLRKDRDRARKLASKALAGAEAGGLAALVAFSRYRLGQLEGGPLGEEKMKTAMEWMVGQGIKRPDRFLQMYSPGFDRALFQDAAHGKGPRVPPRSLTAPPSDTVQVTPSSLT